LCRNVIDTRLPAENNRPWGSQHDQLDGTGGDAAKALGEIVHAPVPWLEDDRTPVLLDVEASRQREHHVQEATVRGCRGTFRVLDALGTGTHPGYDDGSVRDGLDPGVKCGGILG